MRRFLVLRASTLMRSVTKISSLRYTDRHDGVEFQSLVRRTGWTEPLRGDCVYDDFGFQILFGKPKGSKMPVAIVKSDSPVIYATARIRRPKKTYEDQASIYAIQADMGPVRCQEAIEISLDDRSLFVILRTNDPDERPTLLRSYDETPNSLASQSYGRIIIGERAHHLIAVSARERITLAGIAREAGASWEPSAAYIKTPNSIIVSPTRVDTTNENYDEIVIATHGMLQSAKMKKHGLRRKLKLAFRDNVLEVNDQEGIPREHISANFSSSTEGMVIMDLPCAPYQSYTWVFRNWVE